VCWYTSLLEMEALCSSKRLVSTYQTVFCHSPEDHCNMVLFYFYAVCCAGSKLWYWIREMIGMIRRSGCCLHPISKTALGPVWLPVNWVVEPHSWGYKWPSQETHHLSRNSPFISSLVLSSKMWPCPTNFLSINSWGNGKQYKTVVF